MLTAPADRHLAALGARRGDAPMGGIAAAIFEVDPLVCPRCAGAMRIVACITPAAVINQILTHLRTRATAGAPPGARSPPSTGASVARGVDRPPAPRLSTRPEVPAGRCARAGSLVGAARRARASGIEPPPGDDDPQRGRPDDP